MDSLLRNRLTALGASSLAVALGWWLANGIYDLPLLLFAITGAASVVAVFGVPLDTAALGLLLFGYVVGNRGFAQFSVVPGLPALPAEIGLVLCTGWLMVKSAFGKQLPIKRDLLNIAVLLWIAIGSARIIPDLRVHGFVALRDFATIYYAAFFFIAQAQVVHEISRRFLERCLLVAVVVVIPLAELFRRFPEFFLSKLTFGGIPLIYFKGDLVATFMVVGVLYTHRRWEASRRVGWLLVALGGFVGVLITENRSSLLGLFAATVWLVAGRRAALLRTLLFAVLIGGIGLVGALGIGAVSSRENFALSVYERVLSIADFSGDRAYLSTDVEHKGGNNRFRLIWWQTIIGETIDGDPWLGLGFGHDLAASFVRRYYPDNDDEFSARSPHCILITLFGRTGVIGLLAFLGIVAAIIQRTWLALRAPHIDENQVTAWLTPWIILISACLGVVLEGPMGAVVFWATLGMAAGASHPTPTEEISLLVAQPGRIDMLPSLRSTV
jgi:hypothetical protein